MPSSDLVQLGTNLWVRPDTILFIRQLENSEITLIKVEGQPAPFRSEWHINNIVEILKIQRSIPNG